MTRCVEHRSTVCEQATSTATPPRVWGGRGRIEGPSALGKEVVMVMMMVIRPTAACPLRQEERCAGVWEVWREEEEDEGEGPWFLCRWKGFVQFEVELEGGRVKFKRRGREEGKVGSLVCGGGGVEGWGVERLKSRRFQVWRGSSEGSKGVKCLWSHTLSPPEKKGCGRKRKEDEGCDAVRLTLNREGQWREDLSAKTAIVFLVSWPSGSSRRRLDETSIDFYEALFSASTNRCWILFLFRAQNVKGSEEYCLPPFSGVFSTCDESCLKDGVHVKRASSLIQEFFPSAWNGDLIHQCRRDQIGSRMPLNDTNMQENVVGVFAMLKSISVASFRSVFKPIKIRKHVSVFFSETFAAALELSISNELHHQFLDQQGQDVAPNFLPFSRFCVPGSSLWLHHRQEYHSTSFCRLG